MYLNLKNPLHSSIAPTSGEKEQQIKSIRGGADPYMKDGTPSSNITSVSQRKDSLNINVRPIHGTNRNNDPLPRPTLPTIDLSTPGHTHTALVSNGTKVVYPRNPKTGETISIPLDEIGKASRFGDKTLAGGKCNVFEVVLQNKEETMCPACTRSDKRAKLPAHARNCFGLS
jgi:hypothetical protein